ncbi:SusC/RagA family TonB-linked outer membrane protein [Pedobacter frigoris]|nr:SusC/RagA family TonB-linked outer membrane protein [Pedobacter frigoris]
MKNTRTIKHIQWQFVISSFLFVGIIVPTEGYSADSYRKASFDSFFQDTSANVFSKDTGTVDSSKVRLRRFVSKKNVDSLNVREISKSPFVSLQQVLKGNTAGVYVQETTGEPGNVEQSMLIRGLSMPLLSRKDIYQAQPAVYINGIPLIQDNPFMFDVQKYDYTPIGTATNLLSTLDMDNIKSINIVKGGAASAIYGPRAANGAILITTKNAEQGLSQISVNSYYGMVQKDGVTTANGQDENDFRMPFYQKFASPTDLDNFPAYLRDATNENYYGPSNWTDLYYKTSPVRAINGSITGGTNRSNFRFFGGNTSNAGNADGTKLDKYVASFFINMLPLEWLTVSSMINATRLERDRNRSFRDRFSEMQYVPDLTSPIAPNKLIYGNLLNDYDSKSIDKNKNNSIQGYFSVNAKTKNLEFMSRVGFDYNEGLRDVFFPSTMLDGNNYISNYFGYNQRFVFDNVLSYKYKVTEKHKLNLEAGYSVQADVNRYNYAYGYKGSSDYIKINVVNGSTGASDYLLPKDFIVYRFTDRQKANLNSLYGKIEYTYNDDLTLTAVGRTDGSSNMQPSARWFFSPIVSAEYDLKKFLPADKSTISKLALTASWSRIGNLILNDRFAAGPQYTVDLGWSSNPAFYSYGGFGTLSRPYTAGWVGYDIPWAYVQETNFGVNADFLNNRLSARVELYSKNNNRMLLAMPVNSESGYTSAYQSGMDVNNSGVELMLQANILSGGKDQLSWSSGFNASYNRNKLKALPGGLSEILIGTQKLVVGEAVDKFWVLQTQGVFNSDVDVPVNPANYQIFNYKGLAFHGGDPRWKDLNGDYTINEQDKVALGNYMPKVTGNFSNTFSYNNLSLDFNLYFALGRNILNQAVANRFDFINRRGQNDISSIDEITFWQKDFDASKYPVYNPWSAVQAYRSDQDIFIENGSFLKLRSLSLSYDFGGLNFLNKTKGKQNRFLLYVTATNLFTITPYTGGDPEVVGYTGIDSGYGLSIPKTYTLGFKVDL